MCAALKVTLDSKIWSAEWLTSCLLLLHRWPCCWSCKSRPTTSSLQREKAAWIPLCRLLSEMTSNKSSKPQTLKCCRHKCWPSENKKDLATSSSKCSVSTLKVKWKAGDAGLTCATVTTRGKKLLSLEAVLITLEKDETFLQMGCFWIGRCMVTGVIWCKVIYTILLLMTYLIP